MTRVTDCLVDGTDVASVPHTSSVWSPGLVRCHEVVSAFGPARCVVWVNSGVPVPVCDSVQHAALYKEPPSFFGQFGLFWTVSYVYPQREGKVKAWMNQYYQVRRRQRQQGRWS